MNFSRLIVNGCSFTYGQGLDDPKTQSWPALIANKLGIPLTNLAKPGCGNDRIFRTTLDHIYSSFEERPLYIIAFSHSARREEYYVDRSDYDIVNFPVDFPGKTALEKAVAYNYDPIVYGHKKLLYGASVINALRIKNLDYLVTDYMPESNEDAAQLSLMYPGLYSSVHSDQNKITNFFDISIQYNRLPCGHDDIEAQQHIANYTITEIEKRWQ